MDRITHQVRLANWAKIIEECNNRPAGTTAKQWLRDNGISEKSYYYWLRKVGQEVYSSKEMVLPTIHSLPKQQPAVTFAEIPLPEQQTSITDTFKADTFKADAVIHTGTMVIGISNTISDTLLSHLLEVAHHAR